MNKHVNPSCVVKVGDGRGFIIEQRIRVARRGFKRLGKLRLRPFLERRLVLTAAHCLPKLPVAHAMSCTEERTYANLLGRLNGKRNVWAECLFVDPIADIAVLGAPDDQELPKEAELYDELTGGASFLLIGKARSGKGRLLALDGVHWIPTKLLLCSFSWGSSLEIGPVKGGMSGSPILNDRGRAVGMAVVGLETMSTDGKLVEEEGGSQPILTRDLPGWLLE